MSLYDELINRGGWLSVIGLGYVGLPIAIAFAKKINVIGYDLDQGKINLYKKGIDPTKEVGNQTIKNINIDFTSKEINLKKAKFHIVTVPTPVNQDKSPDLSCLKRASEILGRNLTEKSIVVYESTVYPGITEDYCVPILEQVSGLKCGIDFFVGYSPERVNPGDKINRLENIKKIVSGINEETTDEVAKVYELIIMSGIHRVTSIKVAEAAKIAENSQRDINIAFMNELAMVFERMGIETKEVIDAMDTKWNALRFRPGLVGGHCIGVDPYYFLYEAENLGYHSQIIASGRKVNDGMGKFIVEVSIKKLILANKVVTKAIVGILGITFKENCNDIRNSKVADIVKHLKSYGISPLVVDPWADNVEVEKEYDIKLREINDLKNMDCIIVAVAHDIFKSLTINELIKFFGSDKLEDKILIDVKGIYSGRKLGELGCAYWSL